MKKSRFSTISLILVLLMTLTTLVTACGSGGEGKTTADTRLAAESEVTEAVTEAEILPETSDTTYDGYEFRIQTNKLSEGSFWSSFDVYAEEENGDLINDAVFARNRATEEMYGCVIVPIYVDNSVNTAKSNITAGDDFADCVIVTFEGGATLAQNGFLIEFKDVPYVDLEKPWWDTEMINMLAINNRAYIVTGDLDLVDNYGAWNLIYNKRLAKNYGADNIYETISDGKWTLDVLEGLCKDVSIDLDGDGKLTHLDQWGLISSKNSVTSTFNSCGCTIATANDDGTISFNLNDSRTVNVLNRLYDFFSDTNMQLLTENLPANFGVASGDIWKVAKAAFTEGRALFRVSVLADNNGFRDMEDDFGIVPLPKYDEAQDDYWGCVQAWNAKSYTLPKTSTDLSRTGAILEYFCYASKDTLTPAYFDLVLSEKVARDAESVELLDIVLSKRIVDVGMVYKWGDCVNMLKNACTAETNSIASTIAANQEKIMAAMAEAEDAFA